jgi:uncharacterized protein YgiM (DUF1202 family)
LKTIIALLLLFLNGLGWFAIYKTVNRLIGKETEVVAIESVALIGVVTSEALNMRDSPSADGALILTLKRGDRVSIIGDEQKGWFPVELDGSQGFINGSYISIDGNE